ncbi:MAG TPA: AbrB/MazE/SpoVT family DNA-binding domain-containing protein [Solirubrobacteraceae bacterium]|nr:AbrB/MazE/SpoVT family DNA-binding domain-containing protein [Solirubrobacteraceae bacterium]
MTIPAETLQAAGLRAGDQVRIEARHDGEVRIRRVTRVFDGAFDPVYPPGYLEQLDAAHRRHH